jgi:hypothetical protein
MLALLSKVLMVPMAPMELVVLMASLMMLLLSFSLFDWGSELRMLKLSKFRCARLSPSKHTTSES